MNTTSAQLLLILTAAGLAAGFYIHYETPLAFLWLLLLLLI